MNKTTHARFSLAEYWLKEIENTYSKNDDIIESYVEYFLVICRSIEDYVINDFLETVIPSISMSERSNIIRLKKEYREGNKTLNHKEEQKIINFLKMHNDEIDQFTQHNLVKYFRTLRNWTVHTIFPHIFENQHGGNDMILARYFQRNFVNYLGLEHGGHLLLNNGFSLTLENSDKDSIFDVQPLNKLKESEKTNFKKELETKEAKILLREYMKLIGQFIRKFEK